MVSMIAVNLKNRRQHMVLYELFDKADTSNDGRVSLSEFLSMCSQHGVKLQQEEIDQFTTLANKDGEVCKGKSLQT